MGWEISEGAIGLRRDKSAAVGSAHVVGFLHLFCQPTYTLCRLHVQEGQQYQSLERRRLNAGFRP
jgi:hypothetical protein